MAIRFNKTSVIFGGIILLLILVGCTKPATCPPCLQKECPMCEVCEVCKDCFLPTTEEAYILYECVSLEQINDIINTTNGLVGYINRYCTEEGEENLTELPYLIIKEVGE